MNECSAGELFGDIEGSSAIVTRLEQPVGLTIIEVGYVENTTQARKGQRFFMATEEIVMAWKCKPECQECK